MTKAVIALKMALLQEDAAILLLQHFCSNKVINIFFEIKCLLPFAATSWKIRILIQIKIRYPQLVSTIITFFWRFCFLQKKPHIFSNLLQHFWSKHIDVTLWEGNDSLPDVKTMISYIFWTYLSLFSWKFCFSPMILWSAATCCSTAGCSKLIKLYQKVVLFPRMLTPSLYGSAAQILASIAICNSTCP